MPCFTFYQDKIAAAAATAADKVIASQRPSLYHFLGYGILWLLEKAVCNFVLK